MTNLYIIIYSDNDGMMRPVVKQWLATTDLVKTWRYDLPNSVYVTSEASAKAVAKDFRSSVGAIRCLVVEVGPNYGGWLPKDTWFLFRNKRLNRDKS